MKINRTDLLVQLQAYTQMDSGVVVGNPGVGKTYILSELTSALLAQNIPAVMLRLDFLLEATDAEITESLKIPQGNWLSAIQAIPLPSGKKGVLIFDAFDSARDERLKEAFIKQIAAAKRELPGWSIIVSVRTYDAAKSQKLIELFPAEFNQDNIHCRRFPIPVLSQQELESFLAVNPGMNAIYQSGSAKLKEILRTPFFLFLLELILAKADADVERIKLLKSEIELLEMYWTKVVYKVLPASLTEIVLKNLTEQMVNQKLISIGKVDYLGGVTDDRIVIVEQLLSANILAEQGTVTPKLAYAHNILFDYAVSKLVLKDSAEEILSFISADAARPFYLRPSFIYFFSRLWYLDQERFWDIYTKLSAKDDQVIKLFTKLLPSTVAAKEFDHVDQLRFLQETTTNKTEQVRNILQALRFIKDSGNKLAQAFMLQHLSTELELIWLWDFAVILEQLIEDPAIQAETTAFAACGMAARNLMGFLLIGRANTSLNLDQLASYRGTTMVAKTYLTDPLASRALLESVLGIMDEEMFSISYISYLIDGLNEFYLQDPDFAVKIYKAVFAHQENENVPTTMHSGVLMTFTSNRIDEFEMCYFRLQRFFPQFIEAFPERAIPLGLEIVNSFVHKRHGDGILVSKTIKLPTTFVISGVPASYEYDMSHMWADNVDHHKPFRHTSYILNYFAALIDKQENERLAKYLLLYFKEANAAFNWKKLLNFGANHVEQLHGLLFELLLQPVILYWVDTVYEAARFFELAAPSYNKTQLLEIEKAILSIDSFLPPKERENAQSRILRLLTRIPKSKLQQQKSKSIVAKVKKVSNEPVVTWSSSSEVMTTEMFLSERGVDVKEPENEELLNLNRTIESFARAFQNQYPDNETIAEPAKIAVILFNRTKSQETILPRLAQTILQEVASVFQIVLKSVVVVQSINLPVDYQVIKEIILYCLAYHTEGDTFAEINSSPGSGYSSTPRSEAAAALPYLYSVSKDRELLPVIKKYSIDKNSVTRFHVLKSLGLLYSTQSELFWEIVFERLANETDAFTKAAVVRSLDTNAIFFSDQDNLVAAFELSKDQIIQIDGNNSFLENFLTIALGFYRRTGNQQIHDLLQECLEKNLGIGKQLIFHAFQIIEPENFYRQYDNPDDVAQSRRIIHLLLELLEHCEQILLAVRTDQEITEQVKDAFAIFDTMIQRIYFSMQVNERLNKNRRDRFPVSPEDRELFYWFTKPLLERILEISAKLGDGHMQGHTAHYFIEIMGEALKFDARFSLMTTTKVTEMARGTAYTFDRSAIQEVIRYTEKLLADHKVLLLEPEAFAQVMTLLNIYVASGWPEALELLWKLDEIFR